jgi:uncharacterized membrane protein YkvA (DUF1232 family)
MSCSSVLELNPKKASMRRGMTDSIGTWVQRWRERSGRLKAEAHAVYLASKDPRVPWYAKALAACVLGYLFSPIDLIPDFIPVVGYLDDLVIVPAGLILVIKLIPPEVMAQHREAARAAALERKPNWVAAAAVLFIWLAMVTVLIVFITHRFR